MLMHVPVLCSVLFYLLFRYYNFLYFNSLRPTAFHVVEQLQNCEDILMNFLVSDLTKLPPIKVTHRKVAKETLLPGKTVGSAASNQIKFTQRQTCMASFAETFGYMPLVRSRTRMDPVLWKDPVSNLRKKYRQLEVIWSSINLFIYYRSSLYFLNSI